MGRINQRRTIKRVLRSFKGNATILREWSNAMRTPHRQTSRKLLKNLLKDCHCHEGAFQEVLEVSHEMPVRVLLSAGDWNGLKKRFDGICLKNQFEGEPIKFDDWGEKCYRVVWLRHFADSLRRQIADSLRKQIEEHFEYPQLMKVGPVGDAFLLRTKTIPAIATDEQAIRFMKQLMDIPIDDRLRILSLINLSNARVVWVSPANQIPDSFVSQDSDRVRDVILSLGKPYLKIRALLLQYSIAAIYQKNLQLHFPTPFDVGWNQGNFVPSKFNDSTGWTVPLPPMLRGFPEGVHENSDCSLVEPSLIFC